MTENLSYEDIQNLFSQEVGRLVGVLADHDTTLVDELANLHADAELEKTYDFDEVAAWQVSNSSQHLFSADLARERSQVLTALCGIADKYKMPESRLEDIKNGYSLLLAEKELGDMRTEMKAGGYEVLGAPEALEIDKLNL